MPEANLMEIILLEILRNRIPPKRKFFIFDACYEEVWLSQGDAMRLVFE